MTNIVAITAANAKRWQVAKVVPKRQAEVNGVVVRLVAPAAKARYQAVSKAVCATPDRWPVVAVINEREASGRWDRQLGQGDPWRKSRSMPPWARALPQSSGRWSGA